MEKQLEPRPWDGKEPEVQVSRGTRGEGGEGERQVGLERQRGLLLLRDLLLSLSHGCPRRFFRKHSDLFFQRFF